MKGGGGNVIYLYSILFTLLFYEKVYKYHVIQHKMRDKQFSHILHFVHLA